MYEQFLITLKLLTVVTNPNDKSLLNYRFFHSKIVLPLIIVVLSDLVSI